MILTIRTKLRVGDFTLDVDLNLQRQITAICGASGAGKTSLLECVAGLITPQTGYIALDGQVFLDTTKRINLPPHQRHFGYVFQDSRLFPHMDVRRNLVYGARRAGKGIGFDDIVALLGLENLLTRSPAKLSGGENQRVAIGRALLSQPRLLLLDEPFASVDEARRAEIMPYIEKLREFANLPILYVSHTKAEIERLADEIVTMAHGRVRDT